MVLKRPLSPESLTSCYLIHVESVGYHTTSARLKQNWIQSASIPEERVPLIKLKMQQAEGGNLGEIKYGVSDSCWWDQSRCSGVLMSWNFLDLGKACSFQLGLILWLSFDKAIQGWALLSQASWCLGRIWRAPISRQLKPKRWNASSKVGKLGGKWGF